MPMPLPLPLSCRCLCRCRCRCAGIVTHYPAAPKQYEYGTSTVRYRTRTVLVLVLVAFLGGSGICTVTNKIVLPRRVIHGKRRWSSGTIVVSTAGDLGSNLMSPTEGNPEVTTHLYSCVNNFNCNTRLRHCFFIALIATHSAGNVVN
jgi:hypothetical protein